MYPVRPRKGVLKWRQFRKRHADLEREPGSDLALEEEEQRESRLSPEEVLQGRLRQIVE
jgi:hypothetical protein